MVENKLTSLEAELLLELLDAGAGCENGAKLTCITPKESLIENGLSQEGFDNIVESLLAIKRSSLK